MVEIWRGRDARRRGATPTSRVVDILLVFMNSIGVGGRPNKAYREGERGIAELSRVEG